MRHFKEKPGNRSNILEIYTENCEVGRLKLDVLLQATHFSASSVNFCFIFRAPMNCVPVKLAVITEILLVFSVTPESCLDSTVKYVIILSPIYTSN